MRKSDLTPKQLKLYHQVKLGAKQMTIEDESDVDTLYSMFNEWMVKLATIFLMVLGVLFIVVVGARRLTKPVSDATRLVAVQPKRWLRQRAAAAGT